MSQINVTLSDELERQLRQRALDDYGGKKGSLSKVTSEALKIYLKGDNLD